MAINNRIALVRFLNIYFRSFLQQHADTWYIPHSDCHMERLPLGFDIYALFQKDCGQGSVSFVSCPHNCGHPLFTPRDEGMEYRKDQVGKRSVDFEQAKDVFLREELGNIVEDFVW